MTKARIILMAIIAAIAIGLLEAAWTGPGRGIPTNTWLGVIAILIILLFITWPRVWLIPGLAIVEEATHGFVGYSGWTPTLDFTILNHWSTGYTGINIYPWLLFPLLSIIGELTLGRRLVKHETHLATTV